MSDPHAKVKPGDDLVITAKAYNGFVGAAKAAQLADQRGRGRLVGGQRTVLLRNDSGADRSRFDVLGIDSPIITPTANIDQYKSQVTFAGSAPAAADHPGRFAILAEPIGDGRVGRAWVDGVCPVQVDIIDADHQFADVSAGQYDHLESCPAGSARILWAESGTGARWAIVHLGAGNALPIVPDLDKAYVLVYDPAIDQVRWALQSQITSACGCCPDLLTPESFEVSFSGLTSCGCACGDELIALLNGNTFTLDRGGSGCQWSHTGSGVLTNCTMADLCITLGCTPGSPDSWALVARSCGSETAYSATSTTMTCAASGFPLANGQGVGDCYGGAAMEAAYGGAASITAG